MLMKKHNDKTMSVLVKAAYTAFFAVHAAQFVSVVKNGSDGAVKAFTLLLLAGVANICVGMFEDRHGLSKFGALLAFPAAILLGVRTASGIYIERGLLFLFLFTVCRSEKRSVTVSYVLAAVLAAFMLCVRVLPGRSLWQGAAMTDLLYAVPYLALCVLTGYAVHHVHMKEWDVLERMLGPITTRQMLEELIDKGVISEAVKDRAAEEQADDGTQTEDEEACLKRILFENGVTEEEWEARRRALQEELNKKRGE